MVTATHSRATSLTGTILPLVTKRAKLALTKAVKIIPRFVQDNFVAQGTRGKSGKNRWARVSRRQLIWRKTYPHDGSAEQKEQYWKEHRPLRDTDTLFDSFKAGRVSESADGMSARVTSTTNYGWMHEYGEGTTPDGKPLWHRPHMYLWAERDIPIIRTAFWEAMA